MKRTDLIWLSVLAVCLVLFAGCAKKKEAEEKEHGQAKKEHGEAEKEHGEKKISAKDNHAEKEQGEKDHGKKGGEAKDSVQLTDENLKTQMDAERREWEKLKITFEETVKLRCDDRINALKKMLEKQKKDEVEEERKKHKEELEKLRTQYQTMAQEYVNTTCQRIHHDFQTKLLAALCTTCRKPIAPPK